MSTENYIFTIENQICQVSGTRCVPKTWELEVEAECEDHVVPADCDAQDLCKYNYLEGECEFKVDYEIEYELKCEVKSNNPKLQL